MEREVQGLISVDLAMLPIFEEQKDWIPDKPIHEKLEFCWILHRMNQNDRWSRGLWSARNRVHLLNQPTRVQLKEYIETYQTTLVKIQLNFSDAVSDLDGKLQAEFK